MNCSFLDEILSPTFAPTKLKFPNHIHTEMDEKFQQLADTILSRSTEIIGKEGSAPYEIPEYPIVENERKFYFEKQLSSRLVECTLLLVWIHKHVHTILIQVYSYLWHCFFIDTKWFKCSYIYPLQSVLLFMIMMPLIMGTFFYANFC